MPIAEGPQYWSSSQSTNQAFFTGLATELKAKGQTIGVYTVRCDINASHVISY